jgi:uncharacterized protein (DUF1800 family)
MTPPDMAAPAMATPGAPPAMAMAGADAAATNAPKPPPKPPSLEQQVYRAEAQARIHRAAAARAGLVERLVAFWSNHFCVAVQKAGLTRITAGAFEREAIRPYVLGRFGDMLAAVETHPVMLFYLDNQQSAGPHSRLGARPGRGLNENLGREILELHTLGVNGGYTQADVTSFANIITGWTFAGRVGKIGEPGAPVFLADFHEPGPQTVLGKTYMQDGRDQGLAVLADLARHPATAHHIAWKFAAHFVADDPPAALVDHLGGVFLDTDGDLGALTRALVNADLAWTTPGGKIRNPWLFLVAAMRATAREPADPGAMLGALNLLGQPLWAPPGPNGFPDNAAAWASPEGMKIRLEIASQIASRIQTPPNPVEVLDAVFGDGASSDTRQAVMRAETRQQGLALLLMSPEFQRV